MLYIIFAAGPSTPIGQWVVQQFETNTEIAYAVFGAVFGISILIYVYSLAKGWAEHAAEMKRDRW